MGRKGIACSTVAIVAGAAMYWPARTPSSGIRLSTIGVTLIAAGATGVVASAFALGTSRRSRASRHRTAERAVAEVPGQSTATAVHKAVH